MKVNEKLLELGEASFMQDGGDFYNWLCGKDNKCNKGMDLLIDIICELRLRKKGKDAADVLEDIMYALDHALADFAEQTDLEDEQDDSYGSDDKPSDEYDNEQDLEVKVSL